MKPSKMLSWAFWCGFAMNIFLTNTVMNFYGLDAWVAALQEGWLDIHWGIWLVIAWIPAYIFMRLKKQVNE